MIVPCNIDLAAPPNVVSNGKSEYDNMSVAYDAQNDEMYMCGNDTNPGGSLTAKYWIVTNGGAGSHGAPVDLGPGTFAFDIVVQ